MVCFYLIIYLYKAQNLIYNSFSYFKGHIIDKLYNNKYNSTINQWSYISRIIRQKKDRSKINSNVCDVLKIE